MSPHKPTLDAVLTAVRTAPLSTLDDVKSLLAVCVSRIEPSLTT